MTPDELASIEDSARGLGPEHSVRRLIEALREADVRKYELIGQRELWRTAAEKARAEVLELENRCSDLEMDLTRANGFLGAARAEIACLRGHQPGAAFS